MFEVELKYRVDNFDRIVAGVAALGGQFGEEVVQADQYLAHPVRDFAATDEALRVRRNGEQYCLTYKGPKLDRETKTRREIELPLVDGRAADQLLEVFSALAFRPVATVVKRRREAQVEWNHAQLSVTLDSVERGAVGLAAAPEASQRLGIFVEIETVAATENVKAAQALVNEFAHLLGLDPGAREYRSYLELTLDPAGND